MVEQISKALIYVSYFSGVVPLYFVLNRKYVLSSPLYRLLGVLLVISALSDFISYTMAKLGITSVPVVNIYFMLMFVILSFMFSKIWGGPKAAILKICMCCVVFFFINSFYIQSLATIQSYSTVLSGVILLGYSLVYYDHLINTIPARNILSYPLFWINSAIAYYYCFNLFLFIVSTYTFENLKPNEVLAIWIFHNVNNIVKNGLFTVGLLNLNRENIDAHNIDN